MSSTEPTTYEIDAGSPDEARAKIASSAGANIAQLQILNTTQLKTWPWQAKRYHYRLSLQSADDRKHQRV